MALCTVEKLIDFSTAKDATAIAVISKVVAPSKPQQHAADLYIEAMEVVRKEDIPRSVTMMSQLTQISNTQSANPATSSEVAWQQRKCRRLLRYPTLEASTDVRLVGRKPLEAEGRGFTHGHEKIMSASS